MFQRASCRLEPLGRSHLETVRAWRNSKRIQELMFSDGEISPVQQKTWFEAVTADRSQRFFVFAYESKPFGISHFKRHDSLNVWDWGFYIGVEDAPAHMGSLLGFCSLEEAFGPMAANRVETQTFCFNERALAFQERLGFKKLPERRTERMKGGRLETVEALELTKPEWNRRRDSVASFLFQKVTR